MSRANITLTGFMGTGKTAVGRQLAARTGRDFIDTDDLIVQRSGLAISEIFEAQGEAAFRQMEAEIALELMDVENSVIATGGKMALDPVNAIFLMKQGPLFCLTAEPDLIVQRLAEAESRPLLNVRDPESRIRELLSQRASGYAQFPQIDTSGKNLNQVAEEIDHLASEQLAAGSWRPKLTSQLTVSHPSGQYPLYVGWDLLKDVTELIPLPGSYLIITDSQVNPLYGHFIGSEMAAAIIELPGGEEHKNLDSVRYLYQRMLESELDRSSTIVALGGGVVGDTAGFAAATYMRGIELLQCPTTLLAMVDASLGGKTGVDLPQGKNLVGAFKQPIGVVTDLDVLQTLPAEQFRSGMAEVVKHGLIANPRLLKWIEDGWWQFDVSGNNYRFQALIVEAISVKRDIIQKDPFEINVRAHLNLGHTFAHAIESVSNFEIGHGYAVSMGLVAAANLSSSLGFCGKGIPELIEKIISQIGLPTRIPSGLSSTSIYNAMKVDKKKKGGKLHFVLLRQVGDPFIASDIPESTVISTLDSLKDDF